MMNWIDPAKALAAAQWAFDTAKQSGDAVGMAVAQSHIEYFKSKM